MRRFQLLVKVCVCLMSLNLFAADVKKSVPDELKPWIPWVNKELDFLDCPMTDGGKVLNPNDRICAWPDKLEIEINRTRGKFEQNWKVFQQSWVPLPGDNNSWPSINVNGRDHLVQSKSGRPYVFLEPGVFKVTGYWRWEYQPEDIFIPQISGRLSLKLNSRSVAFPEVKRGMLWLGERQDKQIAQKDSVQLDVFRLIADGHPLAMMTKIRLNIAGGAREINLGKAVLDGFRLINTESNIPSLVNRNGELIVQARPGQWEVDISSHGAAGLTELKMVTRSELWPKQEIWSYKSYQKSRVSALENLPLIDPESANVPSEWESFASFLVTEDKVGIISEKLRGIPKDNINRLVLNRDLWLDFDGEGWRFADRLSGLLRQHWRLYVAEPFKLEHAEENGASLLVTEQTKNSSGIEVRVPKVSITAGGSIQHTFRMPINGWQQTFDETHWELNLPPAYRLIFADGAETSSAWFENWGLWDLFWLLLLTILVWKSVSIVAAIVTFILTALMFHELSAPLISLTNLIFSIALYQNIPNLNKGLTVVKKGYFAVSLLSFVIFAGMFAIHQVRLVIHPQLEQHSPTSYSLRKSRGYEYEQMESPSVRAVMSDSMLESDESLKLNESKSTITVTGSRIKPSSELNKYQSDTVLQTGEGKPAWHWNSYFLHWNSPVSPEQIVRLWVVTPGWMMIWRVMIVFGLFVCLSLFIYSVQDVKKGLFIKKIKSLLGGLLLLIVLPFTPKDSMADMPSDSRLDELKQWLHQSPECHPDCISVTKLTFNSQDTTNYLSIDLQVDALADSAFKIPQSLDWFVRDVSVNGQYSPWVATHQNEQWIWVEAGRHQIQLSGPISEKNNLIFKFSEPVYHISNLNAHWELEGVKQGSLISNQLGMIRKAKDDLVSSQQNVEIVEPMVRVSRTFYFENEWFLMNRVERIAPLRGAINIDLPLYSWEQVTSANHQVKDNVISLQIPAGERIVEWRSIVPVFDELELSAFNRQNFVEEWRFVVAHQWRVEFSGVPEVWPDYLNDQVNWEFRFLPRAGEALQLKAKRPRALKGNSQSFDNLTLLVNSGKRQRSIELAARYRSTRGGQGHIITGPGQQLDASIDGEKVYLQIQDSKIDYPVVPGEHQLNFQWKQVHEFSFKEQLPEISVSASSSNLLVRWQVPKNRWVLWTSGPVIGPAIIYWGELVAFVLISLVLWRTQLLPVSPVTWFILGLGLSTQNWVLLITATVWLVSMQYYCANKMKFSVVTYNVMQLLMATFSVTVLISLIAGVPVSLLGQPDMGIMGNGSSNGSLNWYLDASNGTVPEVAIYSAPIWIYKTLMLGWALWLAFTLVSWSRLGWQQLLDGGFFKKEASIVTEPAQKTDANRE